MAHVENDIRAGYAPGETTDAADPSLHRPIAPPGMKVGCASARRAKARAPSAGAGRSRFMSAAVCVRLHLIGSYTRDTWPNKAKTQLYDRPLHVQHKAANRNLCVVVEASVREPQYVQSESVPHTKFVDS